MTKTKVPVILDSNEEVMSNAVNYVRNHPDISEWHVDDLEVGDLIVADTVCIEIKSPTDFASSITEDRKRLKNQAKDMTKSGYDCSFILIRGDIGDFKNLEYGPPANALRGAMASVTIRYGVPVIPVGDMETLVDMAVRYGRKTQEEESSTPFTAGTITNKEAPVEVRMLSAIEGIDEVVAWNLHSKFGPIQAIERASVKELTDTPQVGEERAKMVKRALPTPTESESTQRSWTT